MGKQNNNNSWARGKCIGKGSFGTVNVAINKANGTFFAVKSVSCNNSYQVGFLENEIQILRSLSSPYIVNYLGDDVSHEFQSSYRNLHVEYMPGGTVADVAAAAAATDERILRSFTYCIVSALKYLHDRGIAHTDVKGRNVLVGVGPNSSFCKLADFGSAVNNRCTNQVSPRGSPLWMAPEVIRGEFQGPESDVWSLGCTVVEMITGKPAWEDFGVDTLSRIGFSTELPEFPTQLSQLGRDFVDKCLRRETSERWSCDQLLQHPFLVSVSPVLVTESSPRCVLDWVNSEFEDDDDYDYDYDDDEVANCEVSARERIGKLATKSGAIWESDGWVAVRIEKEEKESENCGERTRMEYPELTRIERETVGTSSVYSDSLWIREGIEERTNMEFRNSDGGGEHFSGGVGCSGCGAGSSCRHGSQKVELAVEKGERGIYYNLYSLLVLCYLTIFRFILLIYSVIYYILCLLFLASICAYDCAHLCFEFRHEVTLVFTTCRLTTKITFCSRTTF